MFNEITQTENSMNVCYPITERIVKCGKPLVDREFVNNVFSAYLILFAKLRSSVKWCYIERHNSEMNKRFV